MDIVEIVLHCRLRRCLVRAAVAVVAGCSCQYQGQAGGERARARIRSE